ncbi:MAG: hypothetical protein ACAH83_19370 [Alphaproteobacteria bacterium]
MSNQTSSSNLQHSFRVAGLCRSVLFTVFASFLLLLLGISIFGSPASASCSSCTRRCLEQCGKSLFCGDQAACDNLNSIYTVGQSAPPSKPLPAFLQKAYRNGLDDAWAQYKETGKQANFLGGGWVGICPPLTPDEESLQKTNGFVPNARIQEDLERDFPPGKDEKGLADMLAEEGFAVFKDAPCSGDVKVHFATLSGKYIHNMEELLPLKSGVFWKVSDVKEIVWIRGFLEIGEEVNYFCFESPFCDRWNSHREGPDEVKETIVHWQTINHFPKLEHPATLLPKFIEDESLRLRNEEINTGKPLVSTRQGWKGACPPATAAEEREQENGGYTPSPGIQKDLESRYPPGTDENLLIGMLAKERFKVFTKTSCSDSNVHFAVLKGRILWWDEPIPMKAAVFWRVDANQKIIWIKGYRASGDSAYLE